MILITDSQRLIIDAFFLAVQEHPDAKHITTKMIAKKAGISRQNVYKHFRNLEELIILVHRLIDEPCVEKLKEFRVDKEKDLVKFFAHEVLPLLYEKRDWLKLLYEKAFDPNWTYYIKAKYQPVLEPYLKKSENKIGFSNEVLFDLIAKQVLAVIIVWLTSENPEPASIFEKKFIALLSTPTSVLVMSK